MLVLEKAADAPGVYGDSFGLINIAHAVHRELYNT